MWLACTGHEVYFDSSVPWRLAGETDAMLRVRLRRVLANGLDKMSGQMLRNHADAMGIEP